MKYETNKLHQYINHSVMRIINEGFHIRFSKELVKKYDSGDYDNDIAIHTEYINEINSLNIKYPGKASPVFYIYVVPDENFVELLNFPFPESKAGGKPVSIFDLDGFNSAYGRSQNCLENNPKTQNISRRVNGIHEFAHLVHGQFFNKNRILNEGFSEVLPLYTMRYEEKFNEHRKLIIKIKSTQIISPKELLDMEANNTFGKKTRVPNKSCSFDWAYISSYLFVRGYILIIAEKFNLDRISATQKFLEVVRSSKCRNEFLLFDLAEFINMDKKLILSKKLQLLAQKDILKI